MNLSATVNIDNFMNRLRGSDDAAELRSNARRADHLSRVGSVLALDDVDVSLRGSVPTAKVKNERAANGAWDVSVTTRAVEQDATAYDRAAYDMLIQETLLVHEVGHILYTDNPSFKDAYEDVTISHRPAFQRFWNAMEDGAIEEQLRREFNVGAEIDVLNANLFAGAREDFRGPVTFLEAVHVAAMDLSVWNTGRLGALQSGDVEMATENDRELFEEVLPILRETAARILREPDGAARNTAIKSAWDAVEERIPDADATGADRMAGQAEGAVDEDPKPNDADPEGSGQQREARELEEVPEDLLEEMLDAIMGSEDDGEADEDGDGAGEGAEADESAGEAGGDAPGSEEGDGSETETDASEMGPEAARATGDIDSAGDGTDARTEELEDKYLREIEGERGEHEGEKDAMSRELGEMAEALETAQAEGHTISIEVPEPVPPESAAANFNAATHADGKRMARQLTQVLGDRLRQERRARKVRGRATGRLDTRSMRRWERGDHRIFSQQRRGQEKDYNALIILDRSGSMYRESKVDKVTPAEVAVGGLSMSLEEVGVDVSVLDFKSTKVRLIKPFGVPTDSVKDRLFTRESKGKTPLGTAMHVARQRLRRKGGNTFVIVVTDGQSTDGEPDFGEELEKCNFPVLGVYVALEHDSWESMGTRTKDRIEDAMEHYHRHTVVCDEADLSRSLRALAKEVMF